MRKVLLFLPLLFLPVLLQAGIVGKISGRVVDGETKEPLLSASVLIAGTTMGAATNAKGEYYILNVPPGQYTLAVRMLGYVEQKISNVRVHTDLTTALDFKMTATALLGEAVEVVAERPLLQKDVTATQNLLRGEEIAASAVNSFTGAMAQTAGFVVTGVGEGGAVNDTEDGGIHVRGGRGGQLGYMIDGFYVEDALYGGLGSDVTRNGIEELSVLTGTFNAEYGEALSGVVNLVTKEGRVKYEGSLRYATDELLFGNLGDAKHNNWHTRRQEFSLGGPLPLLGKKFRFYATFDHHATNTYLNVTKSVLSQDAHVFGRPDSLAVLFVDKNGFVQLPEYYVEMINGAPVLRERAAPGTTAQPQKAGAVHYHNHNTFNFQYRGNTKLTFTPSASMKLIVGATLTDQKYKNYSQYFKMLPNHANHIKSTSVLTNLTWNHTLATSTFYTLKVADFRLWEREGLGKPYDQIVAPRAVSDAFGGQSNYEFAGAYLDFTANGDTVVVFSDEDFGQGYRSWTQNVNFDMTSQVSPQHQLKLGAEFKRLDLRNHIVSFLNTDNIITYYRFKPVQAALYVQDKMEFEDMVINLGLRWDYLDPKSDYVQSKRDLTEKRVIEKAQKKIHLSPRLGFGYPVTDRAVLHFAYGRFTQNPDYNFFYRGLNFGVSQSVPYIADHFIVGNPNLKPERSTVYELGTKVKISENLAGDVTVYYKDIYDYVATIYFPDATPQDYFTFINEDYANVRGLEVTLEKRFSQHFSGRLAYTFSHAEGNSASEFTHYDEYINQSVLQETPPKKTITMDWDQPHTLSFVLDVREPKNWGVNFYGRFGSGFPYSPVDARGRLLDESNSARRPWTGTVDMRIAKEFFWQKLHVELFSDVTNIFNKRNVITVFQTTGSPFQSTVPGISAEAEERPNYFGPPRHVELGVQIEF